MLDREPTPQRQRYITPAQDNALAQQVNQWLSKEVIEPIPLSPYFNNLVFVAKKNGDIRVCIDGTPANDVTEDFDWPLPSLQNLRYEIRGSTHFTRLDLKDAFLRISVPARYRSITSFRHGKKQFQFKKMPWGFKTAPATFQRFMDANLSHFGQGVYWYIDDILIYAESLSTLRELTRKVKEKILAMGCQVNEDKSEYEKESLLFVGIQLQGTGVSPNLEQVAKVLATPTPSTKKEAQSALGLVSYLRDFIPLISHFNSWLYPDKQGLRLDPGEYQRHWQRLLRHIASAATSLRHWRQGTPAQLYTDASNNGLGCILIQEGNIVAVTSRKLTPAETRYSATDREHIALVHAAIKFKLFLHQSTNDTKVFSDHAALITRRDDDLMPKQARWKTIVKYWIPNLTHVKGIDNPADYISRWMLDIQGGVLKA